MTLLVGVFTVLALLHLLQSVHSLGEGIRFLARFRDARRPPSPDFAPPATLVLPFRGVDPGLEENLEAYFRLEYPDLQILLVTDDPEDPCVPVLERVRARFPERPSRVLFAGPARGRSQKVHNLLRAVENLRSRDEVVAFGDSDTRPHPGWLRHLVAPLRDPAAGAATGFRWYVPREGNFASVLRSVWNAGVATLLAGRNAPFAWGGAMALRRETLETSRVPEHWEGALSDDYAVTRAVREGGLEIRFSPGALGFSHEDCTLAELLEWSFRQLAITRVYRPALWRLALAGESFANLTFWGGWAVFGTGVVGVATGAGPAGVDLAAGSVGSGQPGADGATAALVGLAGLLLAGYVFRSAKGWLRLRALRELFPAEWRRLRRHRAAYLFWGPLASFLTLAGALRPLGSREIRWRGTRYRMVSPTETVVLE